MAIDSPADQAMVTQPTNVLCTVTGCRAWELDYRTVSEDGQDDASWTTIASGTNSLSNASAGQFDPTLLLNGNYEVCLTGWGQDGKLYRDTKTYLVAGGMKIGNMSFSVASTGGSESAAYRCA